jgi:hypothetical protein
MAQSPLGQERTQLARAYKAAHEALTAPKETQLSLSADGSRIESGMTNYVPPGADPGSMHARVLAAAQVNTGKFLLGFGARVLLLRTKLTNDSRVGIDLFDKALA